MHRQPVPLGDDPAQDLGPAGCQHLCAHDAERRRDAVLPEDVEQRARHLGGPVVERQCGDPVEDHARVRMTRAGGEDGVGRGRHGIPVVGEANCDGRYDNVIDND